MTDNLKPTSKVIQITTGIVDDIYIITALCSDGSIWERYFDRKISQYAWSCILEEIDNAK